MTDDAKLALYQVRLELRRVLDKLALGDTAGAKASAERGVNVIGRTLEMDEERRRQS